MKNNERMKREELEKGKLREREEKENKRSKWIKVFVSNEKEQKKREWMKE